MFKKRQLSSTKKAPAFLTQTAKYRSTDFFARPKSSQLRGSTSELTSQQTTTCSNCRRQKLLLLQAPTPQATTEQKN